MRPPRVSCLRDLAVRVGNGYRNAWDIHPGDLREREGNEGVHMTGFRSLGEGKSCKADDDLSLVRKGFGLQETIWAEKRSGGSGT